MAPAAQPYAPPSWLRGAPLRFPASRVRLAQLPTPLAQCALPAALLPEEVQLWVKRDDETAGICGGNKLRKLEFLLAEAMEKNATDVITIGGMQSNHCRATANAARQLGFQPHVILRGSDEEVRAFVRAFGNGSGPRAPRVARLLGGGDDVTRGDDVEVDIREVCAGNVIYSLLIGASIHLVTRDEYAKHGSRALTALLAEQLRESEGKRPYEIPVGGSNALGTWGYLACVEEMFEQWDDGASDSPIAHVVVATGSGGTAAGLALGLRMHPKAKAAGTKLTCYCVCDDPEYFYRHAFSTLRDMGAAEALLGCGPEVGDDAGWELVRDSGIMEVRQAKGLGYAIPTAADLAFVSDVAVASGLVLDPVYTGKALARFAADAAASPKSWSAGAVVFVHTGGGPSLGASACALAADVWAAGMEQPATR